MMMKRVLYIVYAIKSLIDGRIYVGFTEDIQRRLAEHNSGRTRSTKGYHPWKIIYKEDVLSRQEARAREKYLKSGSEKEFLKEINL